jgi:Protein of unknown function (DUF3800)
MILTAYYDESGTHSGSPITVLAGFVGNANDWVDFDREWRKILNKYNITHVHAKHLWHRQGQHKKWSIDQAGDLWSDLIYVVQERKQIFASKTVLLSDDYKHFYLLDGRAPKERLDSKYALCFRSFLYFYPKNHYEQYPIGGVNFVLEAGHRNAGDAIRVFNEIKGNKNFSWREAIGSLTFGAKQDFPALQAADMLAYWLNAAECKGLSKQVSEDERYVSYFERELRRSGLTILDHRISPDDLKNMRQNFLRRRKKAVFGKAGLDNTSWEIESMSLSVPGYEPQRR